MDALRLVRRDSSLQVRNSNAAKTGFAKVKMRSQSSCALGKGVCPSCSWGLRTRQRGRLREHHRSQRHKGALTVQKSTEVEEWVGSRKKYIFGSRDFIVYLAPSLPNCLQKLQNAQAPDSSSPWQGKVAPDLQKGAERLARRNVKLKGEEKQHDCALQNAKPAFALFGTFMQVFIPLFIIQHPCFVIYHIISNIFNMLYYLF